MFEFVYRTYAQIECDMDFTLYPFDTQDCVYSMKSGDKNMTYEVKVGVRNVKWTTNQDEIFIFHDEELYNKDNI